MNTIFRSFRFDQLSFLIGLLSGFLLSFLLWKLRPYLAKVTKNFRSQSQISRSFQSVGDEVRLANDTLKFAQGCHIASNLFSLDEILVPTRLLAPPVPPGYDSSAFLHDITDWTIPFLPDWPELGSHYNSSSINLAEALTGGANIVITGHPGSGKTVALASFVCQLIRQDPKIVQQNSKLNGIAPLFVHAADLLIPTKLPEDPIDTLINAITRYTSSATAARLPKLLQAMLDQNRCILLVDGADELSPDLMNRITEFIGNITGRYPGLQIVTTAAPDYSGKLTHLGFFPIPIAGWDHNQRLGFLSKWGALWSGSFNEAQDADQDVSEHLLLSGWLLNNTTNLNPLELTLKVWAAYAGDSIGPTPRDAVEAYVRRHFHGQPPRNQRAFEHLASQMVLTMRPVVSLKEAESCLGGGDLQFKAITTDASEISPDSSQAPSVKQEGMRAFGAMPQMITNGLIIERAQAQVSLVHPWINAYVACQEFKQTGSAGSLATQPLWSGRNTTLGFLASEDSLPSWLEVVLVDHNTDPLLRGLFQLSRWLSYTPEKYSWATVVMRSLADVLHNDSLALGLKAKAMTALALSGNKGVLVLFRQMMNSPQGDQRQLAALAVGLIRDPKLVDDVKNLLRDPSPSVSRAALLALVSIGSRSALDYVADVLIHGDETLSQAAAEAIANHPEEGYPTLEEGSTLEDPKIRKAAAFGLARTRQPAAIHLLEKLRADDDQWIVQDAASQLLNSIESNPHIPNLLPELIYAPWLIGFAGEKGMGVAPGKPALDLVYQALREGSDDQRLAAIYYLGFHGNEDAIPPLLNVISSNKSDIREAALSALWNLGASAIKIP